MTNQITRQRYQLTTESRQTPITSINIGWNIGTKIGHQTKFRYLRKLRRILHFKYLTIKYTGKYVKLPEHSLKKQLNYVSDYLTKFKCLYIIVYTP